MDKSTTISDWLRSGEYRAEIDSVYTKITRGCDNSDNEAQTASVFEKEIYYLVRSQLNIEISFSKEEPIEGVIQPTYFETTPPKMIDKTMLSNVPTPMANR